MSFQIQNLTVGKIPCTVVWDGRGHLGADGIFKRYPNVSQDELRQAFKDIDLSIDDAESHLNCMLLKTQGETLLIDTGNGHAGQPDTGQLMESLKAAGVSPEEINTVIITHAHSDHVNGILNADDSYLFPNASYRFSKVEWDYWTEQIDDAADDRFARLSHLFDKIEDKTQLIEQDEEIAPGLQAVQIPGHTPGQIGIMIESEGERLFHVADLLHSRIQFAHPEWSIKFDNDPDLAAKTRHDTLARAADEKLLLATYHLPFPGLGHVQRVDGHFRWVTY